MLLTIQQNAAVSSIHLVRSDQCSQEMQHELPASVRAKSASEVEGAGSLCGGRWPWAVASLFLPPHLTPSPSTHIHRPCHLPAVVRPIFRRHVNTYHIHLLILTVGKLRLREALTWLRSQSWWVEELGNKELWGYSLLPFRRGLFCRAPHAGRFPSGRCGATLTSFPEAMPFA